MIKMNEMQSRTIESREKTYKMLRYTINKYSLFIGMYTVFLIKNLIFAGTTVVNLFDEKTLNYMTLFMHLIILFICAILIANNYKYSWKQLFVMGILLFIGIGVYYSTKSPGFLDFMLILFAAQNLDTHFLIKKIFKIQTVILIFLWALATIGIIKNAEYIRYDSGGIRYSGGFTHANGFGIMIFSWICMYLYLTIDKKRIKKYVIALAATIITFLYCKSYTAFALSILAIALLYFFENSKFRPSHRYLKLVIKVGIALGILLTVLIIWYLWGHRDIIVGSSLLSRIILIESYFSAYDVNLFGNILIQGGWTQLPGLPYGYYFLDNSYLTILLGQGILAFLATMSLYLLCIRESVKSKNICLVIIFSVYAIYALLEPTALYLVYNVFLLEFSRIIFDKNIL